MCSISLLIYFSVINLLSIFLLYDNYQDIFECYACQEMDSMKSSYDYIVIGSGSAGSIVARRLAEEFNVTVLLLEAGSTEMGLFNIPSMGILLQKSLFDWQYRTVPQEKACLALENQASLWPMGRIFGGTSKLNNMIYVRGHPNDYKDWTNKTDYNYDFDILPYFKKLENSQENDENLPSHIINDPPFLSRLSNAIMESAKYLGYPIKDVLETSPGFYKPKGTIYQGKRWSPSNNVRHHSNIVIRTNAVVQKVLLKHNPVKAYGVKYKYLKDIYSVRATKAVILSAGVIGTPKILMLSGIGPKKHLEDVNIISKVDLPVGENLQDHVATGFDLVLLNQSLDIGYTKLLNPMSSYNWFMNGQGPFGTIGCDNLAFLDTSDSQQVPELQLMVIPLGVSDDRGIHLRKLVGIDKQLWKDYFAHVEHAVSILPVVLHPKSRGFVRLRDSNPESMPLIDPKYLTDPEDVDTLLQGIELIKELIFSEPMKRFGASLNRRPFPGCEHFRFDSKSYWECYVRRLTLTVYHPVGTCPLGTVLEYDFRVKGVRNLYVVDGSSLPNSITGNPNGAIMMMAERASDLIKKAALEPVDTCDKRDMFMVNRSS